tara:strand:- start:663 stop:1292 length:630 start_codon:yes stop_codon:yes gene_type:complete
VIFINHRVNTISELLSVPSSHGAEIDVRYHNNDLIIHHDPFEHQKNNPELLKDFLEHWNIAGPLILNLKTEGIEEECITMMDLFKIKDWFFLDISMPYMVSYSLLAKIEDSKISPKNLAVRFSEYEPIEYALSFSGRASWVWVDCFNDLPLDLNSYQQLKDSNFQICIVSPELQKHPLDKISDYKNMIKNMKIDAVCTKRPDLWLKDDI